MAAYDESLKIELEKSEVAANAAIKKYNGLKPEDRKKEANIDAVATALVAYYKDALAKEAQVTKATATKGSDTKKISAWLIADADNFKKVVGVDLGFITWDAGDIATANEISKENIGKLIDVEQDSSVKTPLEKWKSASSAVFSDNFNSGNNPRRLPVSKDEVIAAAGGNHVDALKNGNYGSLGKMIWATAETASLQAIIDQVETYKALKEAFTAQKAVEQAAQDKANTALADAVCMALVVVSVGTVSLYALYLSFFFMSIMFPTIFALGLEGMGSSTKKASSYIVMGVAGGAFAPMLMGYIGADNMAIGFVIPLLSFLYILYFALRCKKK